MKNKRYNYILIAFLALILFFAFFYFANRKTFIWYETYRVQGDQPYDLSVVFNMLGDKHPGSQFEVINDDFNTALPENGDYIFIGENAFLSESETSSFLRWVEKGNSAMFITKVIPKALEEILLEEETCPDLKTGNAYYFVDTIAKVRHLHPKLNPSQEVIFKFKQKDKTESYDFGSFDESQFCANSDFVPLGTIQGKYINFIQIPVGKGFIYVHLSPLFFTNYQLIDRERASYASGVLSYLKSSKLYWDEYHRFEKDEKGNNQVIDQPDTPLSFILGNTSLRWSFYVILATAVLYFIIALRRKQKIIPVMEPLRNSSLEFVQATGRLYFLQRNHILLLEMQMKYLLEFIRERYRIKARTASEVSSPLLSNRSGIEENRIQQLFDEYNRLSIYVEISDAEAISFYQLLNHFYKNCH
ncbi:MAG: DUF4350 domain-containing protein [Bacteroidia bacterium]